MSRTKLICLTPVRNEEWILERFLLSTSLWADHIIVLDQESTDKTVEIALKFPKVILLTNTSKEFNEPERQRTLIEAARKIPGDKILIALDADESLTANSLNSKEWQKIKELEKGTIIKFDWVNLLPSKNTYWLGTYKMPFGFIDDGSEHKGRFIHSTRVPAPEGNPVFFPKEIKVMHFQYADWKRMESKHRWYQCFEHIQDKKRSVISIYRQYHHMYAIAKNKFHPIPPEWLIGYFNQGINYRDFIPQDFYYWDYEVALLLKKYNPKFFSRIDIWKMDWEKLVDSDILIKNTQSNLDRIILKYLEKTQPYMNNIFMKIVDRIPRIFF